MIPTAKRSICNPPNGSRVAEAGARWQTRGAESLDDSDLVTLLVASERHDDDPWPSSHVDEILETVGGIDGLARAPLSALRTKFDDTTALRLCAAFELSRRALARPLPSSKPWACSQDVVDAFRPRLGHLREECVFAVLLDARNHPTTERRIADGGPATCAVSLRAIFAMAVREGAAGLILVHNHPSGDPTPSSEDVAFTLRAFDAGQILEVPLLDHVIVARSQSFSFLDAGLLDTALKPRGHSSPLRPALNAPRLP